MLTADQRTMNLVALGMAKISYGALRILRRYLGGDLEIALIGFAIVMRTRRDLFQLVEQHGMTEDTISKISNERGFYTSINEISQYTEINRATVRRKMLKLRDLGILEKVDDDKWHLKDFEHGSEVPAALMLRELLQNYLVITNKLEAMLPYEVLPVMEMPLTALGDIEAKALLEKDINNKMIRGLAVKCKKPDVI